MHTLDASIQDLRAWIEQDVRERGFVEPEYVAGAVAECFSGVSVPRARRHELDKPHEIKLRCVQDVTTADGAKFWSSYLHSGSNEVKVAELHEEVLEFSEEGMVDLHNLIFLMEARLRACFDAIQHSAAATRVTAAQEALRALRQPLVDQISRGSTVVPQFAPHCPFCLAEIEL